MWKHMHTARIGPPNRLSKQFLLQCVHTSLKLTILTSEYQMGPQKLTCQSCSNQTTHLRNMLLPTQLFQTLQQPYLWWICMSCGQHTSSNIHDTKEIWTRNYYKPDIFCPHQPAQIEENILLTQSLLYP